MMTLTAIPAESRFTPLAALSMVRAHDMRQFMQACLFAFANAAAVVGADLDAALERVSMAPSPSARNGYRARV